MCVVLIRDVDRSEHVLSRNVTTRHVTRRQYVSHVISVSRINYDLFVQPFYVPNPVVTVTIVLNMRKIVPVPCQLGFVFITQLKD